MVTTPATRRRVHRPGGWRSAALLVVLVSLMAACASHQSGNRFITRTGSGPIEVLDDPLLLSVKAPSPSAIRQAEATARASRAVPPVLPTIEASDRELRDALALVEQHPTPASHLRVAQAYWRVGVLDRAFDHFDAALTHDPKLAAAYDGRARIWRDWHLPGSGVPDAARAVYYAPRSAAARNTLGTLLLAMGDCTGAREAFRRAHVLDPGAAYAEKNLAAVARALEDGTPPCRPVAVVGRKAQ
jgi:tetratricopeptide (TPR) repeat protein